MTSVIHDIELPPEPLPEYVFWLIGIAGIVLVMLVVRLWRKYQHPIAKARRQLKSLPDNPANINQLVKILRAAACKTPNSFDHARFAPKPCSLDTFLELKREAKQILEQEE